MNPGSFLLLSLLFVLCSPALFAGSNDAVITGQTESGRTSFELVVGDITGSIRSVKLTIDGKSYEMKEADVSNETVIQDKENGLYFLVFETPAHVFRLWMIPNSEKVSKQTDGAYHSTFGAVLEASDPRENSKFTLTPRITIGCSLTYEI